MTQPGIIDTFLEKPYHLIDVLPKQVPADSSGRYFEVEKYFLSELGSISRQFADILIKLNCYADITVSTDGESWIDDFSPEDLINLFEDSTATHSPLYILVNSAQSLITFSGEDHYMTIYDADEELNDLLSSLASREGLFYTTGNFQGSR